MSLYSPKDKRTLRRTNRFALLSLQQRLKSVASPEFIVVALVLWFMVALSLHILLADGKDDSFLKDKELGMLRSVQRRAMRGLHREQGHNKKPGSREHYDAFVASNHQHHHPDPHWGNFPSHAHSLRQEYEHNFPPTDTTRIRNFVQSLRNANLDERIGKTTDPSSLSHKMALPYDPLDCPDTPHPDYPVHYSLVNVLEEWPVDVLEWPATTTDIDNAEHPYLFHSLCIFDWDKPEHRERIKTYQINFDLPFLLRNHPEILKTSERWMRDDPAYLQNMIGSDEQRTEHSTSNHLPFWRLPKSLGNHAKEPKGWMPPTENIHMTFTDWYDKALAMDRAIAEGQDHTQMEHFYFRLNGDTNNNAYLYDELPIFDPRTADPRENIFMWEPDQARGINCRWGMAGNVAEAHYDASRNWILLLGGGQRRYILGHPRECPNLALYPLGHPSARHSAPDWSEIGKLPPHSPAAQALAHAQVTQVVMQASDALFLPTHWFHFIVSLNRNYQCNARSGLTNTYSDFITACGFTA